MLRYLIPLLFACLFLSGCEKIMEAATKVKGGPTPKQTRGGSESLASQVQIESAAKPEIVTAFEEISSAMNAHNAELVRRYDAGQPGNGPAYSAGILQLDKAARKHGGLTKQIIDAVNLTLVYEKGIFVVFDTMDRHFEAVTTRGGSAANQRRSYIQILDRGISTYSHAIRYLENGEEAQLRYNFKKKQVPADVTEEFLRLRAVLAKTIPGIKKEMFSEGRAALQSYRSAYIQTDSGKMNEHLAEGERHQQKSNQLMAQMISELRGQLSSSARR